MVRRGIPPSLRCAVWLSNIIQSCRTDQDLSEIHEYRTLSKVRLVDRLYESLWKSESTEMDNAIAPIHRQDVKLVDFGSACELETVPNVPGAFKFLKEKTGSLTSMAPEVIQGKYGPKADIWSIGIVAYTLLNDGVGPFPGTTK